jgi:hypothetical protein
MVRCPQCDNEIKFKSPKLSINEEKNSLAHELYKKMMMIKYGGLIIEIKLENMFLHLIRKNIIIYLKIIHTI